MTEAKVEAPPAKWQVTATTIHCDLVDDFVTIMVYKDWTTRCVWYHRYKAEALEGKKQKIDKKMRLKVDNCAGPLCSYVTDYRDKLIQEEKSGGN